ncbi:MAG: LAGLIDADG family homing endonuclease [Alphaproteobacteria bacterium]
MTRLTAISQQIWNMKYRLKSIDGRPVDKTVEDTWRRVAQALAEPETETDAWAERFFEAMSDFRFLPAGRILAGAGSGRNVTLFNCFVMGDVPDDMAGIFEHLKEAALTMQQGGGIGYDFSSLRPKGAPVKGVGADASGPLSFMDVWDAMCRTIISAGYRRGAMMATMRCDHPDIEDFIAAKREPGRLRMFNLSVLVTDAFMQAVREDAPWELVFEGVSYETLPARELWDKIMRATYTYAEPGVIFIDRINRLNNLSYCETIHATNPCVTADTWVQTDAGPRRVADLQGVSFTALVDGKPHRATAAGFFRTARKPVVRIVTREGYSVRVTGDHLVRTVNSKTRYSVSKSWTEAGALARGDMIVIHDHRERRRWPGPYEEGEGYLIGLLVGDGTLKRDKAVLSVWPGRMAVNGDVPRPGVFGVMERVLAATQNLPKRADFCGWVDVAERGERRLALGAVRTLALELGLTPGNKAVTPRIEEASSDFYRGFLQGLFDADGAVLGTQEKGVSIRLAQSDLSRLEAVQRMLLRLGIFATVYRERRPAQLRELPDGNGGTKAYFCAPNHELVISNENVGRFADLIGFADTDKAVRLKALLSTYRRRPNRERFIARVAEVVEDGVEDVYDAQIPGVNAFDANGIYVHNCGEQPLPAYGVCLLGSINLAKLVRDPFTEDARLDTEELERLVPVAVRMMDNVIEVSPYPLPAHAHEARAKRRVGLGVTGLADALIMCRARYGAEQAVSLTETWLGVLRRAAYLASTELAKEKGAFPLYDAEKYLAGETVRGLEDEIRAAIAENGIRNALLTTIAPTGTISLLADNVSSGIEPVFAQVYSRAVLMPDGERREEQVADYAYRLFRHIHGEAAPLPEYFIDAQSLSPGDHVVMQAAAQKYIDSSISKTINLPTDIPYDDFKDVYTQAYDLGCKGCTTYRPSVVTGAVLEAPAEEAMPAGQAELPLEAPPARPEDVFEAGGVVYMTQPLSRPEELPGHTYKLRWPETEHALYITLNDIVQDGRRRPFEVFINSKSMEHYAWTVALTRMISAVFRRGGDVSFVVDELKAVFDPRGGQWMEGRYVPSLLAAIGEVIERHMIDIGFLPRPEVAKRAEERQVVGLPQARLRQCPKCGAAAIIRQEDCDLCTACAYEKCG